MLLMLFSLIVLALPITIIGANFDEEYRLNRMREMCARWVKGAAPTSAAIPGTGTNNILLGAAPAVPAMSPTTG